MGRPTTSGLLVAFLLTLAACGGNSVQAEPDSTDQPATQATTSTTPLTTSTLEANLEPGEAIQQAVNEVLDAGSYALAVTVELAVKGDVTETELEGWVDGSDRELTMKADEGQVTTRVIDGVATVERDGEVTEVPLQEAGDSPSLEILNDLHQPAFVSETEITGTLTASALKASGFDINGTATVTIYLTTDGSLAGYEMTGNNGNWTVNARFSDIGQPFTD